MTPRKIRETVDSAWLQFERHVRRSQRQLHKVLGKMSDTGYLIRRLRHNRFGVTSWGDDKHPLGVYTIEQRSKRKFTCDCPTRGQKECKHIPLVRLFIQREHDWDPYKMVHSNGDPFKK